MTPEQDEDGLHQLAALYRQNPPADPSEGAWDAVLGRVAAALPAPAPASPPRVPPRGAGGWGPLAGAAAVAAVVSLALLRETPRPTPPGDDDGPWEVATAAEVQILGVTPSEADQLALVGRPQMGEFAVASFDEIKVLHAEPNPDGETRPELDTAGPVPVIDWAARREERDVPEPK